MTDDLELLGAPNCGSYLEPMDATVGVSWCDACQIAVRPEDRVIP